MRDPSLRQRSSRRSKPRSSSLESVPVTVRGLIPVLAESRLTLGQHSQA